MTPRKPTRHIYYSPRTTHGTIQRGDYKPHIHDWVTVEKVSEGITFILDHCTTCDLEIAKDMNK